MKLQEGTGGSEKTYEEAPMSVSEWGNPSTQSEKIPVGLQKVILVRMEGKVTELGALGPCLSPSPPLSRRLGQPGNVQAPGSL